jgi:hypothetical protein
MKRTYFVPEEHHRYFLLDIPSNWERYERMPAQLGSVSILHNDSACRQVVSAQCIFLAAAPATLMTSRRPNAVEASLQKTRTPLDETLLSRTAKGS